MQVLLITFAPTDGAADLSPSLTEYARAITAVEGLVTTTWVRDGPRFGAIHLFEHEPQADAYLQGPIVAELMLNPTCTDFQVDQFLVVETI